MNIGFDLDKIFIDFPPLVPDKLINSLYKNKSNGTLSYRIPSKPEQIFRLITHHPILRPPITENIEFIKAVTQKSKDKHYLISSRFHFLKGKTEEIIKKYQFNKIFDEMFFNFENKQPHLFKNGVINKLKINRYVDDDIFLIKFLALNNPKTIFYWLNNNEKGKLRKNLVAITSLAEMFKQ